MSFYSSSTPEYQDQRPEPAEYILARDAGAPGGAGSADILFRTQSSGSSSSRGADESAGENPADGTPGISILLDHMNIGLSLAASAQQGRGLSMACGQNGRVACRIDVRRLDLANEKARQDTASDGSGHSDSAANPPAADPIVDRLSRALEAVKHGQQAFGDVYADALRLAIVTRMLALRSEPDGPERAPRPRTALLKWRLKRVVEHIDAHLDETITLADMASVAGLSPMHFAAQFRVATGVRPHEFLLRRRIDRAKQMLAETETSLVEVALSVGFQTQAHFTTVFRRFTEETPHRWRLGHRVSIREERREDRVFRQHPPQAPRASFAYHPA